MLVYSEETKSSLTNRLRYLEDVYLPSDTEADFTACTTFEEVLRLLEYLETNNLHLVGSRGYVYHSGAMKETVELIQDTADINPDDTITFWNLLTRTAGLRETVMRVYGDYRKDIKEEIVPDFTPEERKLYGIVFNKDTQEDEQLPECAIGLAYGEYVLGAQLATRDGRRTGNAHIISVMGMDFNNLDRPSITLYTVLTDAGNEFKMNERELSDSFYPPYWVSDVTEVIRKFRNSGDES